MRLAQLPKQPIQIAKLAGGMSLVDINSKLPKQPVPRAQIGNAGGGVKPLGAKSPIKVVAIAGPGNKKATPVTLQAAGTCTGFTLCHIITGRLVVEFEYLGWVG